MQTTAPEVPQTRLFEHSQFKLNYIQQSTIEHRGGMRK